MAAIDIALTQDSYNVFDISIASNGDLATTQGFDTSLTCSLFTDKRASDTEVLQPERRRGFWGDVFENDDNFTRGSKLWLLSQARITQATVNAAISYAKNSLQWLIDDGYAVKVDATASITGARRNGIALTITVYRSQSISETRTYEIWQNTGA